MNDLVLEDDPILRKKCQPFDFENPQVDPIKLKEELIRAMVKYEGLGISACQIGIDLKVFAMRFDDLSLIHISEPTRLMSISDSVFCV